MKNLFSKEKNLVVTIVVASVGGGVGCVRG